MKKQQSSQRQGRTRTLIQIGGLVQKSGLLDAFLITPGDDLQDYENLEKASRLLGFLSKHFESSNFSEENLEKWSALGLRRLKHD